MVLGLKGLNPMTPEEGHQEAIRRIDAARRERKSKLHLRALNLSALPDTLCDLADGLEALDCRSNQLKSLDGIEGYREFSLQKRQSTFK